MAYVGKLSVFEDDGSPGTVFDFINVNFPGGWPEDEAQRVGEPITAMGVNGTRARYTREDYQPFHMKTLGEALTFGAAVTTAKDVRKTKIKRCTIEVTTNGVVYQFGSRKAYIWAAQAQPIRADVVTALGAIVNPLGMIVADWTLQFIPGT